MDFGAWAERFGLPVAMLLAALATGAAGFWSFKAPTQALLKQKDDELLYRERQIERLEAKVARLEGLLLESQEKAERFADLMDAPRPPAALARRAAR
jgi:hypothetical protein